MMTSAYSLDKIKFATDGGTFQRAVGLYEGGKVTKFDDNGISYTAVVLGTQPYHVFVSNRKYDMGGCDCYLGKNDALCKHMVAVAIRAVAGGRPLSDDEKRLVSKPLCSGKLGKLDQEELAGIKHSFSSATRYIKSYNGPSSTWFAYQDSLMEGCNRLSALISELPVGEQTATFLVELLLRLDKKLTSGGIDDSDGTVGGFIEETVDVLKRYAQLAPACIKAFSKLQNRETCFGWEEPLLKLIKT